MSQRAPQVTCPVCGLSYNEPAYFEMGEGSETECPACGAELAVSEVETVMYWSITTKASYEEHEAKERERAERARLEWIEQREAKTKP